MNTMLTPGGVPGSALDEETARAELYGLLAALYYAPPAPALLARLRVAPTQAPTAGAFLEQPWRALVEIARSRTDQDIEAEYETLFGGVGKPEVYLYASHFLSGFLNEKPLARLRTELIKLGLTRDPAMSEPEDHLAYLCEVMRYLIAGDGATLTSLARQRDFFTNQLQPWVTLMCEDLQHHPKAHFYRALAEFTAAFTSTENQGFDLLT